LVSGPRNNFVQADCSDSVGHVDAVFYKLLRGISPLCSGSNQDFEYIHAEDRNQRWLKMTFGEATDKKEETIVRVTTEAAEVRWFGHSRRRTKLCGDHRHLPWCVITVSPM